MSADNGLYILETNRSDGKGKEYRVAHLQAVENVDYDNLLKERTDDDDVRIVNAREMWEGCQEFNNLGAANKEAIRLEAEIEGGWTEYGICIITIDRVF